MFTTQWLLISFACLVMFTTYVRWVMPDNFFDNYWEHRNERRVIAYHILSDRSGGEVALLFILFVIGMMPIGAITVLIGMAVEAIKK